MAIHLTGNNSYIIKPDKKESIYRKNVLFLLPYFSLFLVIIVLHLSGHSEIGHFDNSVIGQKNIAGGQIAVQNL
jgi:hypothetical protein